MSVLFLGLGVALEQLDESAKILNFILLLGGLALDLVHLFLETQRVKTRLGYSFKLNLQEGHIGRPVFVHFQVGWNGR